jgi:dynein heavy chain 2
LLTQLKLKALILDLIHHIDVMDQLIAHGVDDLGDWHWFRQLRYEMSTGGRI